MDRQFEIVFWCIVGMTSLAWMSQLVMASAWADPTPMQQSAFSAADFVLKAGVGTIFGLLGGRSMVGGS